MFGFIVFLMALTVLCVFLLIGGGILYGSTKNMVRKVGSIIAASGAVTGFGVVASLLSIFVVSV